MIDVSESEKPQVPKEAWQSLCSHPGSIASPDWHADVLAEHRQRVLAGSTPSSPWDDAKALLQRLAE